MSELIELWIKVTKEKEIEEYSKDVQKLYDYTIQLQQENQQLKSMICPIYEKCQKGECDCTHEEYDSMCEKNMEMSVELNKYKSIVKEAIEYIKHSWWLRFDQVYDTSKDLKGWEVEQLFEILNKIKELEEGVDSECKN